MLLTKEVEVGWNSTSRKHYEELGYNYVWRGKFIVPIEHLPDNSHVEIDCLCDYCLEEDIETHIPKKWQDYVKSKNKSLSQKDACKQCWNKKVKDSILNKYKVSNVSFLDEIKEKIKISLRLEYEEIDKRFLDKGYKLLLTKKEYESNLNISSKTNLPYICPNHPNEKTFLSISDITQGVECKYCAIDKYKGENHPNWKGGLTLINKLLRNKLNDWKQESLKNNNYKCAITDKNGSLEVHHLYSFQKIVYKTFEFLNMVNKLHTNIGELTPEEIKLIENTFIKIHNNYGLGVCLKPEVHKLFHEIYGYDNTLQQFIKFKQMFVNK